MDIIESSKKLIAIESTADKPKELQRAIDFITNILQKNEQITIESFSRNGKPSLLAYFGVERPEKFKILFNGHVDVVPAKPEQFQPFVKEGKLYGRGAADMKAAAVVMTDLFLRYADKLPYALGLQIVSDEELGGFDGTKYQLEQGVRADFTIAGEDIADGAVCTEMKGISWVDVVFHGKAAHSGYPWRGTNAVTAAAAFAQQLLKRYPDPNKEVWRTTANIAAIETPSAAYNSVPDMATVKSDFRYTPDDINFKDKETLQAFLEGLTGANAEVVVKAFESSHKADVHNDLLRRLGSSYKAVAGKPLQFIRRHGAADTRYYSERGMQAVTFGLPDNNTHAADEFVEVAKIEQYEKVLESFLHACAD